MIKKLVPLFLVFLLLAVAPLPVQAQEGISESSSIKIEFPAALTFSLRAESATDITEIALLYKINKITTVKVTTEVKLDFDPAPVVEANWKWDMKKAGLPPGAEIRYRWEIEDASGHELETAWDTVRFDDDRYTWNSLTGGNVTLFWYQGDQSFAQELLDAANEALKKLAQDTGAYLERPVKIYIYASSEDLRGARVYPQEWTGGLAFTEYGITAIGIAPDNLTWGKRAMAHELAHLVTYQMTFNPYGDIPTWLNEGLSMYAEGDLESNFKALLDEAISKDELISVQSLSSEFPAYAEEARLCYAESYSLVEFLIRTYGKGKMLSLLGTFKQGSSYDYALEKVYGFDTAGLDDLWRLSLYLELRKDSGFPLFWLWIVVALLLAAGAGVGFRWAWRGKR